MSNILQDRWFIYTFDVGLALLLKQKFLSFQIAIISGSDKYLLFYRMCKRCLSGEKFSFSTLIF